ncbi:MAG: hypothetical protein JWL88_24 [Parcubacteria group bacterium]|nr:hypothetical protein [Parcubacteria group bacterium]
MMPNIGDYVTAKLVGIEDCRQGVYTENKGDGTIRIEGQNRIYTCEGPDGVVAVPDENLLGEALEHVETVRQRLRK